MNSATPTLLPPNSTPLERALAASGATATDVPVPIRDLVSADDCPPRLLGYLAWALAVERWEPTWTVETKRAVVRNAIAMHRRKGTPRAVIDALTAAGFPGAELVEYHGHDYYNAAHAHDGAVTHARRDYWSNYRLRLSRPISIEQSRTVREILAGTAPARCHLLEFDFRQALNLYNDAIRYDGAFTHGVA